jgi:hypothetical protein
MKATLEFNLPEEEYEFTRAVQGQDCYVVLTEMLNWLREEYKYRDNEAAAPIREKLLELMLEEGIVYE